MDKISRSISVNDLNPSQYNGIHLTNLMIVISMISGSAGASAYLSKPVSLRALSRLLAQTLKAPTLRQRSPR